MARRTSAGKRPLGGTIRTVALGLREGDFAATTGAAPAPDLIFYDPFSYKKNRSALDAANFFASYL